MPRIVLKNLTKTLGNVIAVNNLNLEVEDEELFVLVGPNGCGKTTVLRLIAGVIKPDYGDIYIGDIRVNNLKPSQRGVRMVFQNYALYPHWRVYEEERYSNLNFALKLRKYLSEQIARRINEVSEKVGIGRELFPRRPDELSAGQQQRVALGRAISLPPKVFLLDEPLAHLDPPSKLRVRKEIRALHDEMKTTSIYVTNDLPEAMTMADRLAVMKEGAIVQVGRPQEVYDTPINEFVAAFIRSYSFPGRI